MPPAYAPGGQGPGRRQGPTDPGVRAAAAATVLAARRDTSRVVLEGVHTLKHAIRFGARIEVIVSRDARDMQRLLAEVAPDVELPLPIVELDPGAWGGIVGRELPSPALAVAHRPDVAAADVLAGDGRIVVLEEPRHLGNLGAVIRVAAAAGAGGVLVLGAADPWHPTAVRAAAGLQFALPVARTDELPPTTRTTVALDADGSSDGSGIPDDAVVLVGTERAGLSPRLRARADRTLAIPMRPGVSSLNLATAVAVVLYAGRS